MKTLSSSILDQPISGLNLGTASLGEMIRSGPDVTLLIFLRHYGCIFCKEMVRDLKALSAADPNYPRIVFFGQGDLEETQTFADRIWPDMSIVCDPDRTIFTAMGLGKGSVYQMFGPRVWACGMRASFKGSFQGRAVGDIWTMPGAFAVDRTGTILWRHEFEHAGDHPNWKSLPAEIRGKGNQDGTANLVPSPSPLR